MNRHILTSILSVVFAIVFVVGGCRKPPSESMEAGNGYDPRNDPLVNPPSLFAEPTDIAEVDTEGTLFLQLDGSPNTLTPIFLSSMYEMTVSGVLFSIPFTFDKDMKWLINEDITESFEESDDHTTFILKLKPGLTWHDGHPFTAHDIVFSWKQILDPDVPALAEKPGTEPITECVALDDLTVKYVQSEPLATRLWNLNFSVIPKHIFEKEKGSQPDLKTGDYYIRQSRKPIGNGPYKLVEWKENDRIVVERWGDYKGKKPYFKRIVFKIIEDNTMALLSFEKGQVDALEQLSPKQFARETNNESFRKAGYKAWADQWLYSYIGWNMDGSNPFFTDKRVRRAMTHCLNLPLILEKVYYNLAGPCVGIFHPDSWMFNPNVQQIPYDVDRAVELLDEAGWLVDPEDGWRYKEIDGKKVRFQFTLLMSLGSSTAPQIAAIFQEDLKRIGVDMKTRTLEWATYLERVQRHEFQANTAAWGTGTDPDTNWNLWRTEQYARGRNYVGYSNSRVDELFELGRKEFDSEKRSEIYQEIHKLIYEDQPYTWLFNRPTLSAINKRIRGVQFSPRGIYGFDPSFYAWWTASSE